MQLLIVAGNNDMPLDYLIPSARPKWTAFLFALWERALPTDAATKAVSVSIHFKLHIPYTMKYNET